MDWTPPLALALDLDLDLDLKTVDSICGARQEVLRRGRDARRDRHRLGAATTGTIGSENDSGSTERNRRTDSVKVTFAAVKEP